MSGAGSMTREELRDYVDEQRTLNNIPYHVYSELIDGIDTLEQEPKMGHWISGICDNCGYDWGKDAPIASVPNFCPNCGACMKDCRTLDEFIEDSKESEG